MLAVNLKGTFNFTRCCTRHDETQKWCDSEHRIGGRSNGQCRQVNYAASKAGVVGLTKSVAKEFASEEFGVMRSRLALSVHR